MNSLDLADLGLFQLQPHIVICALKEDFLPNAEPCHKTSDCRREISFFAIDVQTQVVDSFCRWMFSHKKPAAGFSTVVSDYLIGVLRSFSSCFCFPRELFDIIIRLGTPDMIMAVLCLLFFHYSCPSSNRNTPGGNIPKSLILKVWLALGNRIGAVRNGHTKTKRRRDRNKR